MNTPTWIRRPGRVAFGIAIVVVLVFLLNATLDRAAPPIVALADAGLTVAYLLLLLRVLELSFLAPPPRRWSRIDGIMTAGGILFALGAPWLATYLLVVPEWLYHRAHPREPWNDIGFTYAFFIVPILLYVPSAILVIGVAVEAQLQDLGRSRVKPGRAER